MAIMNEEKRINGGYEIIESCTIGNNELVIGHNPKAPNPYVCWYCKNGKEYFWGYYCNELSSAREKLNEAMKERKTYEKLKENAFEDFKKELNAEEQKEINELVSFRFGREAGREG